MRDFVRQVASRLSVQLDDDVTTFQQGLIAAFVALSVIVVLGLIVGSSLSCPPR